MPATLATLDFDDHPQVRTALGETLASLVIGRAKALALDKGARRQAASLLDEAAKRSGIKGLDEVRLWQEWRNDLLARPGGRGGAFVEAAADPAGNYLRWLVDRLADPFHVSYRAVDAAARRIGVSKANLLVDIRWPQEVAWARRSRGSAEDRVAIVSQAFLLNAVKDPSAEFVRMADAFLRALDDPGYVMAPEHGYSVDEIAAGYGKPDFGPLFWRHGSVTLQDRLERMPAKDMRNAASVVRKAQASDVATRARARAASLARRANMARSVGVIEIALESGLTADGLVDAQEDFVKALETGDVPVPPDVGLPYEEFCAWLRTIRPATQDVVSPMDELISESDLLSIMSNPIRWVQSLPSDYHNLGGRNPHVFHAWLRPLANRSRPFPRDPVVDFGFRLVSDNFRIRA